MEELPSRPSRVGLALLLLLLCLQRLFLVAGACDLSVLQGSTLYNYSLASPTAAFPHGALSEDGYSFILLPSSSPIPWFPLTRREMGDIYDDLRSTLDHGVHAAVYSNSGITSLCMLK
ncbi:hypothetical protein Taro_050690 [Colocasia esculenta]|uniref:Uncharacterized protein n=1 Tax=Colocasia esculenta TaxID=4460 RepID=A0A843XEF9_COLES|nr:hypothetical protein [Colocasia esculenta]